jgi:hypothetical protein
MFYLIPITILAYKYRMNIGYYALKSYSYLEILYYRWYNKFYMNPDYKLFINGNQVCNDKDIHRYSRSEIGEDNLLYEIEYIYKNKFYRIVGNNFSKLLDYLEKIDDYINANINNKQIYRWISAQDEDNNCYLELVKKYAGPLGDFYNHASDIEIYSSQLDWLKGKIIRITDFRLDEYILDGNKMNDLIKL